MRQIVNNFSAETTFSEKEYKAFIDSKFKLFLEKKLGTELMLISFVFVIFAVLMFGSSVTTVSWIFRILFIAGAIAVFLLREKIINAMKNLVIKKSVESAKDLGTQLNYGFADDNFTIVVDNKHSVVEYSSVKNVSESSDHFVVWCSEDTGFVVDKNGFTFGEVSEFGKFIAEKTGNEIVTV